VRMVLRTKEIREPRRASSKELNFSSTGFHPIPKFFNPPYLIPQILELSFIRGMYGLLSDTFIIWGSLFSIQDSSLWLP